MSGANPSMRCRGCGHDTFETLVDLGTTPLSNAYLRAEDLRGPEPSYPLHALICTRCMLVQLDTYEAPEAIFGDYAYFSSYSDAWVEHARRYAVSAIERLGLGPEDLVVELASNDGYLLRHFAERHIPVLGVEPARNVAEVARANGIETVARFFGTELAVELAAAGRRPRLMVANNVLAHVPDLQDFVAGIRLLLAPDGVATFEFPHLLALLGGVQFDTIYHEHFSYFSLHALTPVFEGNGLRVVDVERLPTHGGSLRLHVMHAATAPAPAEAVESLRALERKADLHHLRGYAGFGARAQAVRDGLLRFLEDARDAGRTVCGYGAPAKGNTLLNYCGVGPDLIEFTVDRSPHKQGLYLPGSHIPVLAPAAIFERRPDVVLILPWNLRDEIAAQLVGVGDWGAEVVVPLPAVSPVALPGGT